MMFWTSRVDVQGCHGYQLTSDSVQLSVKTYASEKLMIDEKSRCISVNNAFAAWQAIFYVLGQTPDHWGKSNNINL